MIIGVAGTFGSGKDTVARLIESQGFEHFSTADILRAETRKMGRTIERESLRQTGNELRAKFGSSFLAEKALKMATQNNVLISGIRSRGEIDFIKDHTESFLIFVDAPIEIRYERVSDRGRNLEDKTGFEEFKQSEAKELQGNSHSQDISYCRDMADFVIQNDGSIDQLKDKIEEILTKIGES